MPNLLQRYLLRQFFFAADNNIPILEDVPLAHALYDLAEEGRYIPRELIEPIAKVVRWLQERKEGKR